VVTGDKAKETEASSELTLKWGTQPVLVYVCDEAAGCEGFDKLEEIVLKDERVALGMKAFRTVKMHPDLAEVEPVLKGKGKALPRMLLVDPTTLKVTVVEKGKLKASGLYSAMKKITSRVYKEKLDKVVKRHIKLLTAQDQLANQQKVLTSKQTRLEGETGKKAEKDLAELQTEMSKVMADLQGIRKQQQALWTLTPKNAPKKKTA